MLSDQRGFGALLLELTAVLAEIKMSAMNTDRDARVERKLHRKLTGLSRGRDCCIKHLHAPAEEEVLAKSPVAPLVPVWGAHNAGRNGTVGPYTSASVYANSVRHRSMSDLTAVCLESLSIPLSALTLSLQWPVVGQTHPTGKECATVVALCGADAKLLAE